MKVCSVEGCSNPHKCRELCNKHYEYARRHGLLDGVNIICTTLAEALERRTVRDGECLLWTGSLDSKGYGQITSGTSTVRAHRVAWALSGRELPEGQPLDHTCVNRNCVEVSHLRLATYRENGSARVRLNRNNKSGHRNVFWRHDAGKWRVKVGGVSFGHFDNLEEAVGVAMRAREEMYGDFAGRG